MLELVENAHRLGSAEFGETHEITTGLAIDLVKLTDPRDRLLRLGMIRHRLFESAIDMRPTVREDDARTFASAGLVRAEVVADNRAAVTSDEILERGGALVVANPVYDDARGRQTPHLPLLRAATVESRPAGLIETDHWLGKHVIEESGVNARQPMRESIGEIPECLRRDRQPVPIHDPRLSL